MPFLCWYGEEKNTRLGIEALQKHVSSEKDPEVKPDVALGDGPVPPQEEAIPAPPPGHCAQKPAPSEEVPACYVVVILTPLVPCIFCILLYKITCYLWCTLHVKVKH